MSKFQVHCQASRNDGRPCRAVLTYLGALGPPGWWGPYHLYGPRGGVGPLCSVPVNPAIHT